uniref:Uncharacterized protein n=1 Tax=Salix viminalis TaxID=40686 RepID=A0A6N2LHU7_SALVM
MLPFHLHSFISSPPPRLSSRPHSPPLHPLSATLLSFLQWPAIYMTMGLVSLMVSLKSKIRGLKMKKPYDKIEKSDSMRVEIRSRKAKKLIEETLKIADSPRSKTYAL